MEELENLPDWLTRGITYFPPKSGDSKAVKNYRPIMYLTTMYKTVTGIIAEIISMYVEEQNLPAEQEGCHPKSKVCKDQLISKAIYEDCKRGNKKLSVVWILPELEEYVDRK